MLTSVTDPEDHAIELDYTDVGLLTQIREFPADGITLSTYYGYTTNGLIAAITNANGHIVQYSYDANGYLSGINPQIGPTISYSNNILGHIEKIILPGVSGNRVTEFDVNPLGQVLGIVYPDSTSENMGYDLLGNMISHTNIEGTVTTFDYLPTRKLTSVTHNGWDGLAITNRFIYDNQFNSLNIIDALGRNVESYALDIQDRPTTITNVENQAMSITYGLGQMVKQVTRFDGTIVSNSYDSSARLDAVYYPDTTINYGYFKNGLLKTVSNESGTISNAYDNANRLTSEASMLSVPSVVNYSLDPIGNPTNILITVAGSTILTNVYSFDAAERLSTQKSDAGQFVYSYNQYNGLISSVSNLASGIKVSYIYNTMDRITDITWKNASGQTMKSFDYAYSSAGMIINVIHENGTGAYYAYDSLHRLVGETQKDTTGTVTRTESIQYDAAGNRTSKTRDGVSVNYALSTGNRLASWAISGSGPSFSENVSGHSSETIGTGEQFGQLWVSNTTAITPEISGTNFSVNALAIAAGTQTVVAAICDVAGNTVYVTNTIINRVVTNAVYSYSTAGCITNITYSGIAYPEKNIALKWNSQYQLTAVYTNGSVAESYSYDPYGSRITTANNGTTNYHVYNGIHCIADVDENGELLRTYQTGSGIDNRLSMTDHTGANPETYYYLTDHLGTVHALADENGSIVESYKYDAWGRVLEIKDGNSSPLTESALDNRYTFQGREISWATGLIYFRARSYDPITGRWLSRDPIGISGGLNLYQAFGCNGVNFSDPLGLIDWKDAKAVKLRGELMKTKHGASKIKKIEIAEKTANRTVSVTTNPSKGSQYDPHSRTVNIK
ncbi:MAG: hypothetical protein DRI57_30985, partial [Deltaproteobacteria bacterium]